MTTISKFLAQQITGRGRALCGLFAILLLASSPSLHARTFTLVVQPVLSPAETRRAFEPLVAYLSANSSTTIELVTAHNFVAYWETMKKGQRYDLILDAAHFTDYRVKRMGYRVLARIANDVSLTLVTADDLLVFDPDELIGKRMARLGSPSMSALRVSQLYPNPTRLPIFVDFASADEAIQALLDRRVSSAFLPAPLVRDYPELNAVLTTEPVPHIALSAAPGVPVPAAQRIRKALVDLDQTTEGRSRLHALRLAPFVPATPQIYDGYAVLLKGVWGY